MERNAVKSSNIASVGYDTDTRTLEVEYLNGGIYHYLDVPQKSVTEMMSAGSIGKYLHGNIRGKHTCKKLGDKS